MHAAITCLGCVHNLCRPTDAGHDYEGNDRLHGMPESHMTPCLVPKRTAGEVVSPEEAMMKDLG